jgi:L-methionine (R)-S-oxide reductase
MTDRITADIRAIVAAAKDRDEALLEVCRLIAKRIPRCDWVGFYLTDPQKPEELILGPYAGEPTEHTRIPFGRGICGQAAERQETLLIPDVSREQNYLSCSPHVRSEIVIPLIRDGKVLGELDIDSLETNAFGAPEKALLERICGEVLKLW